MELMQAMTERYSVRAFDARPIEADKLERVLEAGRLAPTAKNIQPQHLYVLQSPEALEKVRALTRCAYNAPTVLLFAYDKTAMWTNPFENEITSGEQDIAIVATHVMLKAFDEGLGTCWVCYMPNSEVHKAFDLPENEHAALLMPIGYPASGAVTSSNHGKRKPLAETVTVL